MKSLFSQITGKIRSIKTRGASVEKTALETAGLIIEHGQKSGHYDLAANLLNALDFTKSTQLKVLKVFEGKVPHGLPCSNGVYRLGKKDVSLLLTNQDYEKNVKAREEKRKEVSLTAKKRAAEKAEKLADYDRLQKELSDLRPLINMDQLAAIRTLQEDKMSLIKDIEEHEKRIQILKSGADKIAVENLTLKTMLKRANEEKQTLEKQLQDFQACKKALNMALEELASLKMFVEATPTAKRRKKAA